jgi:hypothetical protein
MKRFSNDVGDFNDWAFQGSEHGIDVRNPREHYVNHTMQYWDMGPDGRPTKMNVRVFKGPDAAKNRTAAVKKLNDDLAADLAAGRPATRGNAAMKNTPEEGDGKAEKFDELKAIQEQLDINSNGEATRAYGRMLGLYKNLHAEAARVFKAKIEAMLPGNEGLQRVIYADIFDKMFTTNLLEAYMPLTRSGKYWLTYSARDVNSGEIDTYKQTFLTDTARKAELAELRALGPEYDFGNESEFTSFKEYHAGGSPTAFVAKTVSRIDDSLKERTTQEYDAAFKTARTALDADVAAGTLGAEFADGRAAAVAEAAAAEYNAKSSKEAVQLKEDLVNLALEMMPERSFLQSYKARKGTQGYMGGRTALGNKLGPRDAINMMMRKSSTMARQLADTEFSAKATALKGRMTQHAQIESPKLSAKENSNMTVSLDVLTRAMDNISVQRNPIVKALNTFTYMMTLGFNASSAVMNVMGIPTIVMPYLGGKYGHADAGRAIARATKTLANSGRTRQVKRIDENGNVEEITRDVSRFDATMENITFGAYDATASYNTPANKAARLGALAKVFGERGLFADSVHYDNLDVQGMANGGVSQKLMKSGAWMMHKTETIVRETTAIAAYELELAKRAKGDNAHVFSEADLEAAALEAVYATELTNGTIAAAAQPNFAQHGIMPMMYMFKRYPLAIYNLLGSLANQSYPGHAKLLAEFGDVDSAGYKDGMETRRIARLQLASIVGNVGLWAGVAGMPLYGVLTGGLDMMFKDEDELDADTLFRVAIGEGASRGLANYLLGVEASSRIGLANMFYRDPFRSTDNPPVWNLIEGAGGPVVGLTNSILTRTGELFSTGQTGRAIESLSPASIRNLMKAMRFTSTGGAESSRGDMISEIGAGQVLGQMLGFSPAAFIRQTQLNGALKTMDMAISSQRTAALRRLNVARRENSASGMATAREIIADFNERNPDYEIDRATEERSANSFSDTTARMHHGIQYNTRTEARMRQWMAYFEGNGPKPTT